MFDEISKELTEHDYRRSRNLFIAEGCFANCIGVMSTGVIVSGVLKYLGADDALNGIITGIPVSAGILIIFSPVVFRKLKKEKWIVILFAVLHRLLFAAMLSVPLMFSETITRITVFVVLLALGHVIGAFIGPSASVWLVKLVPESIRGRYFGLREGLNLVTMTSFALIMALVIDYMKSMSQEKIGYLICSLAVLLMTAGNLACLLNICEPVITQPKTKISILHVFTIPLKNRAFRKIVWLSLFWNFGVQIGGPFFSVYLYSVLKLDYSYILLITLISGLARMIAAHIWGRIADEKGWALVSKMSIFALGVVHASFIFLNSASVYFVFPILQILSGVSWAGASISMFNLQFKFAPVQDRTVYIAFNTAISSAAGFSAVLIASAFVSMTTNLFLHFLVLPITPMQILFLVSGLLIIATAYYIHRLRN